MCGPAVTLVFHVWSTEVDTTGWDDWHTRLWEGFQNVSRQWLSGRANERITGIGVWKGPTRDHRLRPRAQRGRRRIVHLRERGLKLRVDICRRVNFIIVLHSSNPRGSILCLPFSSVITNMFSLIGSSILAIFVVSSTFNPLFS